MRIAYQYRFRFIADVDKDKLRLHYVHWSYAHNGFFYQLILFGAREHRAVVEKDAAQIFAGFRQIEPERRAGCAAFGAFAPSGTADATGVFTGASAGTVSAARCAAGATATGCDPSS